MYENLQFQHSVPGINQAMVHCMVGNFCGYKFSGCSYKRLLPLLALCGCLVLCLCLHSTFFGFLNDFSDSCQRHNRWHTFIGSYIDSYKQEGLKRGLFALHVDKNFAVLIFANGSWFVKNAKINPSWKLPTIQYQELFFFFPVLNSWHTNPQIWGIFLCINLHTHVVMTKLWVVLIKT